ncbi:MAG: hypothetical protein QXT25_01555 [Candidatus Anstonellaceae archaeon]
MTPSLRAEICNKISDADTKNFCLGMLTKNLEYCDKITTNENKRQMCYSNIAIDMQNPSVCYKINEPGAFQNCFALASRNVSQCLLDPPYGFNPIKNTCISNFAALVNDDSICVYSQYKEVCFLRVAISNNNAALCESAGPGRDSCYFEIASSTSDASLCKNLSQDVFQQACTAIIFQKLSDCPADLKHICLMKIILKTGDYSQCESIQDITRDECLVAVALAGILKI